MNLEPNFTLSEDELEVIREAIRRTMAEFLENQKWALMSIQKRVFI